MKKKEGRRIIIY